MTDNSIPNRRKCCSAGNSMVGKARTIRCSAAAGMNQTAWQNKYKRNLFYDIQYITFVLQYNTSKKYGSSNQKTNFIPSA